jgi:hypothetical protein
MRYAAFLLLAALPLAVLPVLAQDRPAPTNAVEALQAKLDSGEVKLTYDKDDHGYLKSLLAALGISQDSQVLAFTRSSLQFDKISPKTPRAIFFNDDVAVGSVLRGQILELLANDKSGDGLAFYTFDANRSDKPRFVREEGRCSFCHAMTGRSSMGWMVADISANDTGEPYFTNPSQPFNFTDHRTPFEQRWGGWYVTGTSGAMVHRGNVTAPDPYHPFDLPEKVGLNVTDLSNKFDISQVIQPTSDIVALMTLEHQTGVANRIGGINVLKRTGTPEKLNAAIEELVTYMTFGDEVKLPAPVKGNSTFTETFAKKGPRDRRGRSLRDFELQTRLFRYPLSFMIYSDAFASLHPEVRAKLWRRLYDVLSADKARPESAAAIAIVAATKKDRPDFWK